MAATRPDSIKDHYDVVVIGSGLGGLTAARSLSRLGHSVLVLEQHTQFGGLSTWFRRQGHIFDVSLHGFPYGMVKSCRKYWTREIADSIVQLKEICFDNPQFQLTTPYNMDSFSALLAGRFGAREENIAAFFREARALSTRDDPALTIRQLFDRHFPGRQEIARLLIEPIAYANGSTLDDPALTFGIVFSNFMGRGVFVFRGGTDRLIGEMVAELRRTGVELFAGVPVEKVTVENGAATGVLAGGKFIRAQAVVSNAGLLNTALELTGESCFSPAYAAELKKVRPSTSSTQVYIGLLPGFKLPRSGDLLFTSSAPCFDSAAMCAKKITSRTFSMYYPDMRPGHDRAAIVASANANWHDWATLSPEQYERDKAALVADTLDHLAQILPGIRSVIDHVEAATPRTFHRYTRHAQGASFGTKYEGLAASMRLPEELRGLYHAGSVGIIMSGWLGAINYGVIVADRVDRFLRKP